MLPVAIFHALATAKYSGKIGTLVLIMFIMLLISFGVGFLLKRFMEEPYKKYLPFLVCIYEGGMMAYPLYTSLCGSENLSQIAVLDIAGLLFGFSVYMGMLGQTENGEKINAKSLFYSALKTPAFIGTVLRLRGLRRLRYTPRHILRHPIKCAAFPWCPFVCSCCSPYLKARRP